MLLLRQYKRVVHYMRQYLKTLTHSTHQVSSLQQIKAFTINSKSNLTVYDKKNLVDNVKVGLAVPKYEQDIDSISDLNSKKSTTSSNTGNSSNSFGKSVD